MCPPFTTPEIVAPDDPDGPVGADTPPPQAVAATSAMHDAASRVRFGMRMISFIPFMWLWRSQQGAFRG
jgi:hypothetical protein